MQNSDLRQQLNSKIQHIFSSLLCGFMCMSCHPKLIKTLVASITWQFDSLLIWMKHRKGHMQTVLINQENFSNFNESYLLGEKPQLKVSLCAN